MWSRVSLETSHSIPLRFLRFTQATQVTSLFNLFVLFAFEKWILYKRWILRCVILKARPNGSNREPTLSNTVQHYPTQSDPTLLDDVTQCWTRWPKNFNTWNREVWVQNLATIHRKQRCAILVFSDRVTKWGKARHWTKRRDEKGYFTNIVRELMTEGTTAYREMMRHSSDFTPYIE